MNNALFRFTFDRGVSLGSAENSVLLAALAGEALFGETSVETEFGYRIDDQARTILADGSTPTGSAIVKILLHFLRKEFGDAFRMERLPITPTVRTVGAA